MTNKISRAQWEQIRSRVERVNFKFDPKWKCLLDGKAFKACWDHTVEDNERIIDAVKERFEISAH